MRLEKYAQLACPLDGLALQLHAHSLQCQQGHSYDIARQGYVNLLPVQQKKSKDPGDSKDMVAARTRFLNGGYFAPLAARLAALSLQYMPTTTPASCVDAGCGEGYYLDYFQRSLKQQTQSIPWQLTGLDISKWAVMAAAKRNPDITWVVGNSQHAPVSEHSVDILWSVFGFSHGIGFNKMLSMDGKLIRVDAGAQHLLELREIIYPKLREMEDADAGHAQEPGFNMIEQQTVCYQTAAIEQAALADLMQMTPHLYRASAAGKQAILAVDRLALTVDVRLTVFERA